MAQTDLINTILYTDYLVSAGIDEFKHIRESLRVLIKYIPVNKVSYTTNFADKILTIDWNESELENDDLKNSKMKAEFYVCQHQDNAVIAKLKTNQPLTGSDVKILEKSSGVNRVPNRTMKTYTVASLWVSSSVKSLAWI